MARVAFLGTPHPAVPTLESIAAKHDVCLVITQPDRPQGRSKEPQPPPVKSTARRLDLEVSQPSSHSELLGALEAAAPLDVGVVVAYGRVIRPDALRVPHHGFLNVHFSLLPRWRGAAPVVRALMAGDTMTGTTIMKLDEGLDTGPVITAQAIDVDPEESAGELTDRLSRMGARLLDQSIEPYLAGDLVPIPQTNEGATYADKVESSDRPIQPWDDVRSAVNKVRALAPDPAATLSIDGEQHKLLEVAAADVSPPQGRWQLVQGIPVAGLADGAIELTSIQPPGKTAMSGADWARGRRESAGTIG
jgi:methionyl-tRNA formyltransferase